MEEFRPISPQPRHAFTNSELFDMKEGSVSEGVLRVAKRIIGVYHDVYLSKDANDAHMRIDEQTKNWILLRIEIELSREGFDLFGKYGEIVKYDAHLYDGLPGIKYYSDKMRVVCPGFRWHAYKGEEVVILRATVVPT
jgi:hypothetical protein